MDMTLATLNIGGAPRKVILHAPKNGFFYVIDRDNGKLISAEKLGKVTWAEKVDLATGKPVLTPERALRERPGDAVAELPGRAQSLSRSPSARRPASCTCRPSRCRRSSAATWTTRTGIRCRRRSSSPAFPTADGDAPADGGKSFLVAWDPVKQRALGSSRRRVRTTAARWPRPVTSCSRARPMVTSMPTAPRRPQGLVVLRRHRGARHADHVLVGKQQYLSILTGPLHGAPGGFGSLAARFGWDARIHPRRLLPSCSTARPNYRQLRRPRFRQAARWPEMTVDDALGRTHPQWSAASCANGPSVRRYVAPDLRCLDHSAHADAVFSLFVRTGNEVKACRSSRAQ
jgi:quinohemoprotein ethanol dehydrogenase